MATYTIQNGDTLSKIAAQYGTTVAALQSANGITNANNIRAGATLTIPGATPTYASLLAPGQSAFPPSVTGAGPTISTTNGGSALVPSNTPPAAAPVAKTTPPPTVTPANTTAGKTQVTLGNGATVYVDAQGNYSDAAGTPIPGSVIASSGGHTGSTDTSGTTGGTTGTSGSTGGISTTSTGDAGLDGILSSITGLANGLVSNGYTIPAGLQITPALVSQFLSYAHQAVDPYTQQQISARLADVNSNLQNLATQYGNNMAQVMQDFGTSLATEQNTSGASGVAFSGQRALNETNMANTTNRTLSTLGSQASTDIGTAARAAAGDVGAANAGGIVLPSLATGSVSLAGGSRGSSAAGGPLSYNYTPSIYTVGNIPSAGTGAANQLQQSYLSQYGTLAGAQSNSGRSVSDLLGMISGLPAGYTAPTNLT